MSWQMKLRDRVYQTETGSPFGNCFEACVASVLGCDLEDVPDSRQGKTAREAEELLDRRDGDVGQWLVAEHGLLSIYTPSCNWAPEGVYLASVVVEESGLGHVVVCEGRDIVHNPHEGWPCDWSLFSGIYGFEVFHPCISLPVPRAVPS